MATKDWLTNIEAKNQVAIQKSGNESPVTKDWLSQVETTGASPYIKKTQIKPVAVSNQNNQPLIVTPNQMQSKPLPNPPPVSTILPTNQSPNLIKEAGQSFITGLGGSIMTAGGAAKWLGADGIGTKLTKAGKDIIQSVPPVDTLPWQKAYDPRFWSTTVAQGAGSSVPMMVATIPLAVIGAYAAGTGAAALGIGALGRFVLSSIGGAALSRVAESTLEGGGTYDEAIAKGLSPEESKQAAQKTFAKNMALSGLDAVELATAFFPIKGSGIKNVLKRAVLGLASMGTEGAEEVVQGAISKSSLGEKYDKNEAITEFTVGTILGAGLPIAGNTFNVIKDKVATTFKSEYNQMQSKGKLNDIQIVDQIAENHPNEVKQIVNEVVSSLGNDSVVTPDQALTIASADGIKNTEVGKEITIKAVEAKANDKKVHIAIPEGKESTIVEVVEKSEPNRIIPLEVAKTVETKEEVTPKEFDNKTIFHSGQRSAEQVKTEGLHFSRNAQSQFGEGVYFSDNVETAQEYGDTNIQAEVNTKDYNLKVVEGKDQQAYLDEFNAKSVSEAVRKEGKYDGFIITNPDPQVGNTYVITNLEKLNEKITGKKEVKVDKEKDLFEEAKKFKSAEEFGSNIVNVSSNVKANELKKPSLFTIFDNGNAVGRLHLSEDVVNGRKMAHIDGIEIDKKYRGKGFGTKLMNDAIEALKLSDYDGIVARYETIKNKKEIPYIFNKLGFNDIGDGTATGKVFTDKSQLTDIWNRANHKEEIKPKETLKKEEIPPEDKTVEQPKTVDKVVPQSVVKEKQYKNADEYIDSVRRGYHNNELGKTEVLNPRDLIKDPNKLAAVDSGKIKTLPLRKQSLEYALSNPQKDNILVHEYINKNGETRRYIVDGEHRVYAAIQKGENVNATVIRTKNKEDLNSKLTEIYNQSQFPSPLSNIENDINKELARNAYYWTSFDPDKRAESEIRDYVNALKSDYETLKALAKTSEDIGKLNEMFSKYRAGYKTRMEKYLSAHSKVASSAVTGPARFNSAKNETKANYAHNAMTEMIDYREKMNKVITKELNPIASGVISGKTDDQLTQLNKKLEELKALQEKMKSANKIIKSGKNVNERLVSELGISKEEVDELMKPNYLGMTGFASFSLTNNNAKIKQTEERIANLTKKQEKFKESGNKEYSFDKGKVIFNYEENRLQIIYDNIPDVDTRQKLKSNGFRWSPVNKAWQRILTQGAVQSSVKILGEYRPVKESVKAKEEVKSEPNVETSKKVDINNPKYPPSIMDYQKIGIEISDEEYSNILVDWIEKYGVIEDSYKEFGLEKEKHEPLMDMSWGSKIAVNNLLNILYDNKNIKPKLSSKLLKFIKFNYKLPDQYLENTYLRTLLDEYLQTNYGVTLEKATKKQVRDSLSEIGEPIEYSPELIKKASSTNIMDGVDILNGVVSRPVLVYGGKKLKVYTNGYYLVTDPEAADKINTEIIDKLADKEMVKIEKILKESGEPPNFERKQELRKEWIDSKVNEEYQYPNIESITKEIDKKYQVTKSYVLKNGRQGLLFISRDIDPNENRDDVYNYTSGNKVYGAINYDYLSTIEKYFDKELSIRMDNPLKPVNLYNGDKLVAVIMPIRNDQIEKIRNLESQKQTNQPKTPSGHADVGGYSKVESFEKMIGKFRSIQTPELVQMTKDLLGDAPSMKKMKRALGIFYSKNGTIKLDPKIFTDPDLVAKVLAHELGHATDWLDSKTMKRGNILGRIASLKNYLKKTLPEFEGAPGILTKEDRARIKKEAEELSKNPQLVEEEVVIETKPVEPTDILAIWNDSTSGIRDPKLLEYIQKLDDAKKKQIAVAAMKGKIPEWVTFVREIKGKVTREVIKNSKADIKELYQKMIKDEIEKRRLYDYTTMKRELEDLSVMWKPFNPLQDKQFTKYRFSSPELYADAVSVLLNDPMLLKKEAPNFWRAFFNYISSKPSVQKSFTDTWNLLNKGEEAIFNQRNKTIDESFRKADEAIQAKVAEQNRRDNNIVDLARTLFDDRNYPIIKKIDQAIKAGKTITPSQNPLYALHGFNYLDGKLSQYVESRFEKIFTSSQKVSDGWKNLGKILFYERTINERGELANPWGYDPKTAKEDLRLLEKTFSKEDWKQLQEAKQQFRDAVQESIKIAEESGLYTKELLDQMKANPAYATYQVVDYIDTYISSKVYQQIGTLKDISNPATASVMKLISVFKAAERNDVKKLNIEFLSNNFPDEITEAKTRWNGHSIEAAEPKDPNQGLVVVMENGKPKGYYVPKDVARVLQYEPNQTLDMLAKVTGYMSQSSLYRPLFTSLNLGFQSVNFFRDFMRYWKNIPDSNLGEALTSFPRAVVRYGQALPHAINRGLKISDKLVSEMKDAGILGATYNDYFKSDEDDQRQHIERILENTGVRPVIRKQNFINRVLSPINFTLDMIENLGNIIESLPKIAGYIELNVKMDDAQLAEFLRTSIGSPDFRIGGEATKITNKAFLFSNAIKEGLKTDIAIATSNNPSRAGFWWKTILANIVPAVLVSAVLAGKFGDDLKKKMEKISEYDLTNYINIPLSTDERGKTVHLRVPMDETGRLIHGLVHKIIKTTKDGKASLDDLFNLLSFTGGLVPSISPSFTALGVIAEYLSGRNPYDSFRGRNIIPDNEFAAGQKESFPILFKWLLRNQGLGILVPTETYGDLSPSELQKKLNLPAVGNVIGRWIKVSDQGEAEKLKEITKESEKEKAQGRLDERRAINKAVDEYNQDKSQENKRRAKLGMVESLVGKAPYNKEERAEIKRLIKKFDIAVLKGKADTQINSLINAPTNDLKIELLKEISKTKTEKEMIDFLREVYKYKVISSDVVKAYRRLK